VRFKKSAAQKKKPTTPHGPVPLIQLSLEYSIMNSVSKTDNLESFRNGSYVFDSQHSDVRVLAGHRASIVFPTLSTPTETDFHNIIVRGEVVFLEFAASRELATPNMTKKGFTIHGQSYPLWPAAKSIHDKGVIDGKASLLSTGVTIIGAESSECPRLLYLSKVHLMLDADSFDGRPEILRNLCPTINTITGRQTSVIELSGTFILIAPAAWILQDHTAIAQAAKNDSGKAVPIIKRPVVFPTIGSKILYVDETNSSHFAVIKDFDVVMNGTKTQVVIIDSQTKKESLLPYSKIYVTREEDILNPRIQRVITTKEYPAVKTTYIEDGRDYIHKQLTKWGMWRICTEEKGLKVLTSTWPKSKKEKPECRWLFPLEVIGRDDLNIVSFEEGDVTIDGKPRRVTYRSERSDPTTDDIYLHDIPYNKEEAKLDAEEKPKTSCSIDRLCFNAVIGHAEIIVAGKKQQVYFSTKNGMEMSMSSTPLFAPMQPTGRPVVDVKNLTWVLGYTGKGKEKGHEEKTVLYWTTVTPGLRNFYNWVAGRGKHEHFTGKKAAEIRAMFECQLYPNLVDAYNFMVDGVKTTNPTRGSPWTTWFVRHCLAIDVSDL
jgi:hypothetical protein